MIRDMLGSALQSKNMVMFITAVVFMSGIAGYFNNCALQYAAVLSALAIIAAVKNYAPVKYLAFWVAIFYLGFFNACLKIHTTDALVQYAPAKATIQGQIVTTPKAPRFFFKVNKVDGKDVCGKTIVTIPAEMQSGFSQYQIGEFYEIHGSLRVPHRAGNPFQFDYGKYLRNFDTFTIFYADSITPLDTKLTPKWEFMHKLSGLRNKIVQTHSLYLKSPNLEVLGGIVFGDDAVAPPSEIKESFRNSGLLHILAASGMNVAIIYGFWFFFLRRFGVPYRFAIISGIGLVVIYSLMTGLGASIIRAALMLVIILIGKLIDRSTHSVSLLAFVAMLMLIYNPAFINDVGFQMSFVVTFGLLTTGNYLFERVKDTKIPHWLSCAILIPAVAQMWIAPIQMFYFHTFSTYSVFANILSVPFVSIVSFGGFMSSIPAGFTEHVRLFDSILNYAISTIVFISDFFSRMHNSLPSVPQPSVIQLVSYYTGLLGITLLLKNGFNRKIFAASIIFLLLGVFAIKIPGKRLEIIVFDVQNADLFLIKMPQGKYFVIDTDKSDKAEKYTLQPYLRACGIKDVEHIKDNEEEDFLLKLSSDYPHLPLAGPDKFTSSVKITADNNSYILSTYDINRRKYVASQKYKF